ncbi:NAD+ synthase [Patescibacteria group bacterium]|nr:NAD+ synthase [Patescibacteria group bacterium]
MDYEEVHQKLVDGLKTYFQDSKVQKAVVGLSGGIDSAVTLKIAVEALGAEKVTAILMPETGLTKGINVTHAKGLCEFLEVQYFQMPINSFLIDYSTVPWKQSDIAYVNTKARIRANLLYNYANTHHALVLGTSNKSELLLGYGTKFGDLASDILVIGNLYKTEVYGIAEFMGLPQEFIDKAPTAELFDGQTDEGELGGTYKDIDAILMRSDVGEEELIGKGMNPILVRGLFQRMKANMHKLSMPPVLEV